jgi:predicted small secreted protein
MFSRDYGCIAVPTRNALRTLAATLAAAALGALALTTLSGCNTIKGVGRDVEAVAQGGQDIIDGK